MIGTLPHCDISDITYPQLVGPGGYEILYDVWICGESVPGIGGAGPAYLMAHFQVVSVYKTYAFP